MADDLIYLRESELDALIKEHVTEALTKAAESIDLELWDHKAADAYLSGIDEAAGVVRRQIPR
jgi:hypothetical protein